MSQKYSSIVFLQGDEADEVVDSLFNREGVVLHGVTNESINAAVEYLAQWDMGEYEIRNDLGEGSSDLVVLVDGGEYALVANAGLNYVGLSRIIQD